MYFEANELATLNKLVLERTRFVNDRPFEVKNSADLKRVVEWTKKHFQDDPFKQATFLCCALVAHHPFADGNHRTSLYAGVAHLLLNGYYYQAPKAAERALYDWRFDYEEAHHLESEWCYQLGGWDTPHLAEQYLVRFVETEYGQHILQYYRTHCRPMRLQVYLASLPPPVFAHLLRRYPQAAFRKEVRRLRRTHASQLRKDWKWLDRQEVKQRALPPREAPWRSDR